MACINCENWKWNGKRSVLGIDLMYGKCSELGKDKAHNETCTKEKSSTKRASKG